MHRSEGGWAIGYEGRREGEMLASKERTERRRSGGKQGERQREREDRLTETGRKRARGGGGWEGRGGGAGRKRKKET